MDQARLTNFVERTVDGAQEFPIKEFIIKLYLRKWMFALCVIIPGVFGLVAVMFTPATWVATTQILVRYSSSESAFLQDLIPENRVTMSGGVISEILRSLPTLVETIQRYDIQEGDLYRDPGKVLMGKLSDLFMPSSIPPPPGLPGVDPKISAMAKTFQNSLEESSRAADSALGSKTRPVELLGKDSTLPQSMKGDELITLTVRAFNRTKVAEMTNGLAQTFIDQYYKISANEAHRSYDFLSALATKSEAEIARLEQDPTAAASADVPIGGGGIARDNTAIAKLTSDLASLESDLGRSQQFYRDDSTRVQNIQAQITSLKQLLAGQERIEIAKQVLQQIKLRRFQALNTESLYRSRLVPINIIEPAVTPAASSSAAIIRLISGGVTGMLIGGVFGLALVIIFGLLDQRIFTPSDVERALALPMFGWLPKLKRLRLRQGGLPDTDARPVGDADAGLLQVLAHLDAAGLGGAGSVVAITSVSDNDGKSLVCLLLAKTLARAGRAKILLVDADPVRGSLSRHFGLQDNAGLVDAAVMGQPLAELAVSSGVANLDLLPAGSFAKRLNRGFYLHRLRALFNEARSTYDLVIVDTPSAASSSEALMCCMVTDNVLIVVRSGATRKPQIRGLLRQLQEVAVRPQGVILNFRNTLLPRFIDQGA